ncbi:MAG: FtsX-like permease family protein [Methanobacterium sp.]|nr:FtsX-like permease family protein [Methanobacterium sp.]
MGFILFAAKNIFRSKLRLIFTLILLTIGIMAVAGGVQGLSIVFPSNTELIGSADFRISNMDNNSNYTFSLDELKNIQSTAGVTEAIGTLLLPNTVYENHSGKETKLKKCFIGFKGSNFANNSTLPGLGHIELIKGRLINEKSYEVIITRSYSEDQNLDIGDNITIYHPRSFQQYLKENEPYVGNISSDDKFPIVKFTIVGIINPLNTEFLRNAAQLNGIISLDVTNQLIYNSSNLKFDFINVKTDPQQLQQVKSTINQSNPNYAIWSEKPSNGLSDSALQLILFSLFMGSLLMLIATLKSISERIREFGVLKDLGWGNKRIMAMLYMETTIQTVIAWTITSLIIIFMYLLSPAGSSFFIEKFASIVSLLIVTLAISLIIPLLGTLLPAAYILRLKHTEALKYE